jgi:hypothetical protein
VLGDEPDGAGPCGDHVHAFDEREPDHRADRVATASRPAGLLKIADQTRDLRAVEQHGYLLGAVRRCYGRYDHGSPNFLVQTPGRFQPSRGSLFIALSCPL